MNIALGLLCVLVMGVSAFVLHLQYPYNFPFFEFAHWDNYGVYYQRFLLFHQTNFFQPMADARLTFMYPAPVALLYAFFYARKGYGLVSYLAISGTLTALLAFLLGRAMVRRGIAKTDAASFISLAAIFSYPLWFEFLLGNTEIWMFLFVAAALLSFLRGRYYLAAVLIGIVTSMKIFPFVYFALFLTRRRYREMAVGFLTVGASTLLSLWMVDPDIPGSFRGIRAGLAANREYYMLHFLPVETGFDHSIFGLIKRAERLYSHTVLTRPSVLTTYLAAAAITGLAMYFWRIRKLPLLNQIAALSVVSVLLPPTSHDYTLIHLYFPWSLMVLYAIDAKSRDIEVNGLATALLCLAFVFSPQSEVIVHRAGLSGQMKAFVLIALLIVIVRNRWEPIAASTMVLERNPLR